MAYPSKEWRRKHPDRWNEFKKKNYASTAVGCSRKGEPWDKNEDLQILAQDRPSDRVLAKKLGRSVQAIQMRRTKIRPLPH